MGRVGGLCPQDPATLPVLLYRSRHSNSLRTMKQPHTETLVYLFYNADQCVEHELNRKVSKLAKGLGIPNQALSRKGNFEYLKYQDKEWFWPIYKAKKPGDLPKE